MNESERKKALIRIGEAYIFGEEPNPIDVALAKKYTKDGSRKGIGYDQFHKQINMAYRYFYAKSVEKMTHAEAEKVTMDTFYHVSGKSLESYCKFLRSGPTPEDAKMQWHLEHTRAALEQVEHGFMKLPNHPDYKPRI